MPRSTDRRHGALLLCIVPSILGACGDDEASSDDAAATSSASSGSSTSTSGQSGGGHGGSGDGGSASGGGGSAATGGEGGHVELDPIAGIAEVALIQGGFEFTEGPVWLAGTGVLLFSDIPPGRIHRLTPPSTIEIYIEPSGNSNGLGVDPGGNLLACEHGNRRVTRRAGTGMPEVVADSFEGSSLNSPNDVIVRSDGTVYFTDPPYGISPRQQELAFQGVFRVAPDGSVALIDDTMNRPNGIALSPDESTLYVGDSADALLRRWSVAADGSTGPGEKLVDASGGVDGMAVDDDGNLYATTAAGIEVYRSDGTLRGTIPVPEQPANCAFGGADRRTLYITARTGLYSVVTNVPGKP